MTGRPVADSSAVGWALRSHPSRVPIRLRWGEISCINAMSGCSGLPASGGEALLNPTCENQETRKRKS